MISDSTIYLGVGSGGSGNGITLDVFPDSVFNERLYNIRNRSSTGFSYEFNYGSKKRYGISLDYIPASNAAIINSYWRTNILLEVITGSNVLIDQARIVNEDLPLGSSPEMYETDYNGIIELLEF